MSLFSKLGIDEVTRLTKAGRLSEAMALLQNNMSSGLSQVRPGSPDNGSNKQTQRLASTFDRPAAPGGGARTDLRQDSAMPMRPPRGADSPDLAKTTQSYRKPFLETRSFSDLSQKFGLKRRAPPVPDGARFMERTFTNEAGSRTYKVYVPSGYAGQPLPVVIMLHGCTQYPDDFPAGTGMNEVADEQTFLVVYPRQSPSANMQKCWNWFNVRDQRRGAGEPSIIAGVAAEVVAEFSADPGRVYVAGLSAGGAAAAIMGATYPDVFAAVGVHSGLACGAARDMSSALAAMNGGGAIDTAGEGPLPPTIVFHGDADRTVHRVNADQVIAQARPRAALTEVLTRGETPDGMAYTRTVQIDADGKDILEQWELHGAGHAWSGGSADGSYVDARGPDASREMVRFFLQHRNPA